jgi:hypothetical protein
MAYFLNQKSRFGKILEGLALKEVGIFFAHSVYFKAIWYILWPFGAFYGYLGYFTKTNLATPGLQTASPTPSA